MLRRSAAVAIGSVMLPQGRCSFGHCNYRRTGYEQPEGYPRDGSYSGLGERPWSWAGSQQPDALLDLGFSIFDWAEARLAENERRRLT